MKSGGRLGWWQALLLWAGPLAFLGFFFFYPFLSVFNLALTGSFGRLSQAELPQITGPLFFTFWQAFISTLLTLLVGIPAAYLFAQFKFPGKTLLQALTTIPFILPTVVVAAAFNALLGPRGWVNVILMRLLDLPQPPIPFLNTLWAILLANVFYNTTIVIRMVGNAWAHLDPRLGQAAQALGANRRRVLREVTLPLLRPAILTAALLVFIFDFTSFGVVLLLGGPRFATLEVEIYIQSLQMLNLPLAGVLSLLQLLCTLALTVVYTRWTERGITTVSPRSQEEVARRPRTRLEKLAAALLVAGLVVLLVAPLAALGLRSISNLSAGSTQSGSFLSGFTLAYYRELFVNPQQSIFYVPPIDAARNSLIYASATVLISLSLGSLAAYALSRGSALNRWLDPVLMLPLGTSAVTLGLGFIVAFSVPPFTLVADPALLPMAHSLVALPFVVRSLQPALSSIPARLRQAAGVLGASPLRVWIEVDLPIVARAVLTSAIFAFTISLGEFGATSFLARPDYPTLPVAIYRFLSLPGSLNYGQALAMATLLMLVAGAGIIIIERLRLPGVGEF